MFSRLRKHWRHINLSGEPRLLVLPFGGSLLFAAVTETIGGCFWDKTPSKLIYLMACVGFVTGVFVVLKDELNRLDKKQNKQQEELTAWENVLK